MQHNIMKFRPCIDLHEGAVKQIVGASLKDGEAPKTNFESKLSSADFARMYKESNLTGGHVIMLGPGNEEAALEALKEYPNGMQVGGGINSGNAQKYLDAGASHVIVTSYVFKDGKINFERLDELVTTISAKRLVLDLSCRKKPTADGVEKDENYYVVTDRWQKFTDFAITKESISELEKYCDEFLVHGVDVEGLQLGVIEDLVTKLGEWCTIPVTYAGGARSLDDFERVKELGNGKVDLTIGSALDIFGGELKYADVCAWHDKQSESTAEPKAKKVKTNEENK